MPNRSRTLSSEHSSSPNPTGRRPRGPAHFVSERTAAAFHGLPEGDSHREIGDLLDAVGATAGWSPALVDHFQLLLGWTRPVDWVQGSRPIVWLSVAETAYRLGISTSQVRRNESAMHRLGAIAWKDSPNHRRYGTRNDAGEIEDAWGVNLAPAAALVPELRRLLERRSEDRTRQRHLWEILPDRVRDWLQEPQADWPDIVNAAQLAAGGLGISDHAWTERAAMAAFECERVTACEALMTQPRRDPSPPA